MTAKICDRCKKEIECMVPLGGRNTDKSKKRFHKYYICRDCADDFVIYRNLYEENFVNNLKIYADVKSADTCTCSGKDKSMCCCDCKKELEQRFAEFDKRIERIEKLQKKSLRLVLSASEQALIKEIKSRKGQK